MLLLIIAIIGFIIDLIGCIILLVDRDSNSGFICCMVGILLSLIFGHACFEQNMFLKTKELLNLELLEVPNNEYVI